MITLFIALMSFFCVSLNVFAQEFENIDIQKKIAAQVEQPLVISSQEIEMTLPESKELEIEIEKEYQEFKKRQQENQKPETLVKSESFDSGSDDLNDTKNIEIELEID